MTTPAEQLAIRTKQSELNSFFIDKMGLISVKSYGAKGDGVTDDTAAVTAAKTAASAAGAKSLYFPRGVYNVDSGLNLTDFFLWGDNSSFDGISDTIAQVADFASGVALNALTTDFNSHKAENAKITLIGPDSNSVDDTETLQQYIDDLEDGRTLMLPKRAEPYIITGGLQIVGKNNIKIAGNGVEIKVKDNTVDTLYNSFPDFGLDSMFRLVDCNNVTIENLKLNGNISNRTANEGIESQNCCILLLACENVLIKNCELTESTTDGIHLYRNSSAEICKNIRIRDCIVTKNRRNNISIVDGDTVIITNNIIEDAGTIQGTIPKSGVGIEPDNGFGKAKNISIENNTISGNVENGSYCGGDGASNVTYRNNTVINNKIGININADNNDVAIHGGVIDSNTSAGIRTVSSGCELINGVIITNNPYGITPQAAEGVKIQNCTIKNNTNVGIETGTSTLGFKNITISENEFKNNGQALLATPFDSSSIIKFNNNIVYTTSSHTPLQKGAEVSTTNCIAMSNGNIGKNLFDNDKLVYRFKGFGNYSADNSVLYRTRSIMTNYSDASEPLVIGDRRHSFGTSAPASGSYTRGDIVYNTNTARLTDGDTGDIYVVFGWICTNTGSPGDWRELKFVTG